jgi:LPXTG-motif cell wall-anchored protein
VSGTPAASPSATSDTSASAGTDAGTAAAVAGGAALLILGAGFTVRRHRKVEPKPV